MKWVDEKTKEQIHSQLLGEMKYWYPEVPESSDRLDPVLRLLLGAFAYQIEKLNQKINSTWDQTFKALVRNVLIEGLRWPVPASTVMKVDPTDDGLELDSSVRFLYKDEKEDRNFMFSPWGKVKLLKAEVASAYYYSGQNLFQLMAGADKDKESGRAKPVFTSFADKTSFPPLNDHILYLGIRYQGAPQNFSDVPIFFQANQDVLHQIRWGNWFLSSPEGYFFEENSFCPGVHAKEGRGFFIQPQTFSFLGGLSSGADLFQNLEEHMFCFPPSFLPHWGKCDIPSDFQKFISGGFLQKPSPLSEKFFWIKIKLPEKGDKSFFPNLKEIYFNCAVAVNKKDTNFFKHTAGNQILEVELPEPCSDILALEQVVDSNHREYHNRLALSSSSVPFTYITEERNGHLILWFDFSSYPESIPNSVSVLYSTTYGSQANGIERGKIDQLWERHPGIKSATNILPTEGGMPAKTQEELLGLISSLLRNRGRAVSFQEIQQWTNLFDSRIIASECKNVVKKGPRGAIRAVQVTVRVKAQEFYSTGELKLFQARLERFLKERSLINASIVVNVVAE